MKVRVVLKQPTDVTGHWTRVLIGERPGFRGCAPEPTYHEYEMTLIAVETRGGRRQVWPHGICIPMTNIHLIEQEP